MANKSTYEEQSKLLSQAIDIAIDSFIKFPPKDWNKDHIAHFVKCYMGDKEDALAPEPQYKNIRSLKYTENNVFTYFNEGTGPTVDNFWKEIKLAGLPYKRENKLLKILKAGKIKNDIQYDIVIDVMVPYLEDGLINTDELDLLNKMIQDFERRMSQKAG